MSFIIWAIYSGSVCPIKPATGCQHLDESQFIYHCKPASKTNAKFGAEKIKFDGIFVPLKNLGCQ